MNKIILAVVLALFLAGLGYTYIRKTAPESESSARAVGNIGETLDLSTKRNEVRSEEVNAEQKEEPESALQEEVSLEDMHRELAGFPTAAEVEASGEKLEDLGYVDRDVLNAYEEYDMDTLEKLGNQGDFAAFNVLAGKYARLGDTKKQIETWEKAAAMGSSSAAIGLGLYNFASLDDSPQSATQKKALVEGASWFSVARLRGDPTAEAALKDNLARAGVDYASIDWRAVKQRTEEIYHQLKLSGELWGCQILKVEAISRES